MEKIRTFLAVPVKVDAAFSEVRSRLMETLEGERISWVRVHNYHITIRFLGDTDPGQVETIAGAIGDQLELPDRIPCALNGPGLFGPKKKPRVIWVGFDNQDFFEALRLQVDRALASCGIPPAEDVFRAHLTLGRIRAVRDLSRYHALMESRQIEFTGEVQAESLVLFRSELQKGGPVYSPLKEWHFI